MVRSVICDTVNKQTGCKSRLHEETNSHYERDLHTYSLYTGIISSCVQGLLNCIMSEENISWFRLAELWLKLTDPVNLVWESPQQLQCFRAFDWISDHVCHVSGDVSWLSNRLLPCPFPFPLWRNKNKDNLLLFLNNN